MHLGVAAKRRPHPSPVTMDCTPPLDPTVSRIVLLMSPATYRAGAFLAAARRLNLPVVQGIDVPDALATEWGVEFALDFSNPDETVRRLVAYAQGNAVAAVLAVDDTSTLVASRTNAALGLPHNDPEAALAARDKFVMREALRAGGVPTPAYQCVPMQADPAEVAQTLAYPVVVKPQLLNGSRGVIRANDPAEFVAAFRRTARLLETEGYDPAITTILVEEYLPGDEVAVEALLTDGTLHVLAIFDKPDPLVGPFFEETIYVTPSRHSPETQALIAQRTAESAQAVGLRDGPVHAEMRINERDVWPIELAGRSIGGLCSTVLEFGAGASLEELILRNAAGLPLPSTERSGSAVGVMMIPIPKKGMLKSVDGQDEAAAVPGVTGVEITSKLNYPIVPLPEGSSYLGFIFAVGETPAGVEETLRVAHGKLRIRIDPALALSKS